MKRLLFFISLLLTLHSLPSNAFLTAFQAEKVLPNHILSVTYGINSYKDSIETFHGYYSYPRFPDGFPSAALLNKFYAKQFFTGYKTMRGIIDSTFAIPISDTWVYSYDHTFEVTFFSEHFLSILEDTFSFFGGVHPEHTREAHTFSLQTGTELRLEDLFLTSKSKTGTYIKDYIIHEIQKKPDDYFADAVQIIQEKELDSFQFYLSKEGLIVFFNAYELAPYARGIIEYNIPI